MISCTASFDDGSVFDYQIAEMMDACNIESTFYLPVNWRKYLLQKGIEPMSEEEAKQIAERFVIGSHGVDHHLLTKVDGNTAKREIFESRTILQEMFNQPIKKFCYPRGYYNDRIKEWVKEAGYTSARTVAIGSLNPAQDPYETPTTVHIGYDRKEYNTDWLTYAENALNRAIEQSEKGLPTRYHFWGHGAEINKNNQWDRFDKFLNMIKPYV